MIWYECIGLAQKIFERSKLSGKMFPQHDCSICKSVVGYMVYGEQLYFNGNCGCAQGAMRKRDISHLATYIEMNQDVPGFIHKVFHWLGEDR